MRLFVAVHLGALGAIYATALVVGGGFAGPPMPPLSVASAAPPTAAPERRPATAAPGTRAPANAPAPAWLQRTEVAAPWERD